MEPFTLSQVVEGISQLAAQLGAGARRTVVMVEDTPRSATGGVMPRNGEGTAPLRMMAFEPGSDGEHVFEGVCRIPWELEESDVPHLHAASEIRRAVLWTRGRVRVDVRAACFSAGSIVVEVCIGLGDPLVLA